MRKKKTTRQTEAGSGEAAELLCIWSPEPIQKKPGRAVHVCDLSDGKVESGRSWVFWLCSLAYSVRSRPVRDSISEKGERHLRNGIHACPLAPTSMHLSLETCAHVHTRTKIKHGECSVTLVWTMIWAENKSNRLPSKKIN